MSDNTVSEDKETNQVETGSQPIGYFNAVTFQSIPTIAPIDQASFWDPKSTMVYVPLIASEPPRYIYRSSNFDDNPISWPMTIPSLPINNTGVETNTNTWSLSTPPESIIADNIPSSTAVNDVGNIFSTTADFHETHKGQQDKEE
jgi:hypothetical protein